ncbi:ATP-binding protein [Pseudonocardia xinjiangensis]|uniref:XRE family transcriptional regulator n=1 Tax=Pseudonocardia xinjiangensis TaxID=75289 RepID=A0ABX1RLQ4_9PSEU|nr:helix-turn-helix domain-containing protein [Pseudonocardia xinjiangensis]NMH81303.1 XRE family transcriptional regulator [Pseudonocardia xinjiangensis]
MSDFAELLRRYRTARSLTQEELATRARITQKAVGALERGERRRPYPHTVRALADALGLDDDERARLVAAVPPPEASTAGHRTKVPAPVGDPANGRLPAPAAPVIGRDDQVDAIVGVLAEPSCSVLTLTGPGGVGKTTLALLVAAAAREHFPAGTVLVELADVRSAADVVPAIATALGVPDSGTADRVGAVASFLGNRELLLVLDNVEHVLPCAPAVATLVSVCPALTILATGRVPMRIRAEREMRVAPLDHDMSVRLFRERMSARGGTVADDQGDAPVIAQLCRHADGLPLALELAATAAARIGPRTLLQTMELPSDIAPHDLPVRQRSITATLDWSVRLLSEPARSLLARLSVCVGGFTWADAHAVSGLSAASATRALTELVEHSLVIRVVDGGGGDRFRLLEPVRQHSGERLEHGQADEARAGLAGAVLATARALVDDLHGSGQVTALHRLEAGLGNLRVTLDWLIEHDRADDATELLWLVWLHLAIRGHGREGSSWATRLNARPMTRQSRTRLLVAWAGLEHLAAPADACRHSREALELATGDDDEVLATQAATLAASTALFSQDLSLARELLGEANRRADALGDPYWIAHARMATTQIALLAGSAPAIEQAAREAERATRRVGSAFEVGAALNLRAVAAQLGDRNDEAAALLAEAIDLAVAAVNSWTLTYMLSTLAVVAVRLGDPDAGARLFGAWSAYADAHGVVEDFPTTQELVAGDIDRARRDLGAASFDVAWRSGREAGMAELVELARKVRDQAVR